MKKPMIFLAIVFLLLTSSIAAAGFWQDVTGGAISAFKKSSLIRRDVSSIAAPPSYDKAIDFLNNYPSLANVKTKINSIGGLDALEEAFTGYNPYEAISTKERRFNEVFSRYPSLDEESRIYIIHLAHALWIEKNHAVAWSLRDYNADKITALLERGYTLEELANRRFEGTVIQRAASAWEYGNISKDWYKLFPLTIRL